MPQPPTPHTHPPPPHQSIFFILNCPRPKLNPKSDLILTLNPDPIFGLESWALILALILILNLDLISYWGTQYLNLVIVS